MSLPRAIVLQPIKWKIFSFIFLFQPFVLARICDLSSLWITGLRFGFSHFSVSCLLLVLPSQHCSTGVKAPKSFRNGPYFIRLLEKSISGPSTFFVTARSPICVLDPRVEFCHVKQNHTAFKHNSCLLILSELPKTYF